ncbi:cell division protein FtsZ [Granulicella aggregans]|uniref:Cell division protein FtsZ n=1 Tax=Granulicella aggregans TaxID=474949 RepID=A0A7W7ZAK5_9BACT|nr:cell division protein FtsZ [Granulicella aggregans]
MPTPQHPVAPARQPEDVAHGARIKVVGVGGGGSNAIDRMIDFGLEGVEFIALNTDVQALEVSKAPVRGQLGSLLTHGLSAGSDPNVGRRAAIQDVNEIAEVLEGADMVFITAGLGGGTGTGAAPVIAAIASEMGALTVAIVTRPFNFEGKRRMAIADWGIDHLLRYVDTLIVIPNEKLLSVAKDAPFFESFKIADDFLRQAVQSITDIITTEGVINRDFADVKTTMAGMGYAVMGTASRSGPTRAVDAVMDAMASPLLEEGAIDGARGILINITGSSTLRLSEVNAASRVIQSVAHEDATIIFGAVLDERLGDEVKATVIATGFRNDGRDRSERRARLLRADGPEAAEPEPAAPELLILEPAAPGPLELEPAIPESLEPEPAAPKPAEPEAAVKIPSIEPQIDETPLAESPLPYQHEAIDVPSAEIATTDVEAVDIEAPQAEEIETAGVDVELLEEEQITASEATFEEPGVEALEVEQPEAVSEQIEETAQHADQHLAIEAEVEVYDGEEVLVEDPPQHHSLEVEDLEPASFDSSEPLAANEEPDPRLRDEEEDWIEAIREIARLAEPAFEVEDQETPNPDVEEHRIVAHKAANTLAPPEDRTLVAPVNVSASAHLSTTRRAAMAAYAAVSFPEAEPETESETATGQSQPKPVNAFAQVLEARRRFVENMAKNPAVAESSNPALVAPLETHELAPYPETHMQEESRRYDEAEVETEPVQRRQARLSRPVTIEAEPARALAEKGTDSRDGLGRRPDMALFNGTVGASGTDNPGVKDDLPKSLPDPNRRLQREGTEERNGELFESRWNSQIPVPSFGFSERKSHTEEVDDLDTPSFLRRGK